MEEELSQRLGRDVDLNTILITELYSQPPVDEISDDDILAEIRAVRQPSSGI